MDPKLIIRGKRITPAVLRQTKSVVAKHWDRGRVAISRELSRVWDWRQENGYLKEQVCRILLRKLEDKGFVTLPPAKSGLANRPHRRYYVPPSKPPEVDDTPLETAFGELPPIRLTMVRRTADEWLWNFLVYRYHYAGFRIIVGAHLKYIVWAAERPVACLSWSSRSLSDSVVV